MVKASASFFAYILAVTVILLFSYNISLADHPKYDTYNRYSLTDTSQYQDSIYLKVDTLPMFPGGVNAYNKFINVNAHYPKIASDNNIMGEVLFRILIEKDGGISDIRIIREPGSGMGEEATRLIKLLPKWTPAIKDGKPVRTWVSVPVNFILLDNNATLVTGTKPEKKH